MTLSLHYIDDEVYKPYKRNTLFVPVYYFMRNDLRLQAQILTQTHTHTHTQTHTHIHTHNI